MSTALPTLVRILVFAGIGQRELGVDVDKVGIRRRNGNRFGCVFGEGDRAARARVG